MKDDFKALALSLFVHAAALWGWALVNAKPAAPPAVVQPRRPAGWDAWGYRDRGHCVVNARYADSDVVLWLAVRADDRYAGLGWASPADGRPTVYGWGVKLAAGGPLFMRFGF